MNILNTMRELNGRSILEDTPTNEYGFEETKEYEPTSPLQKNTMHVLLPPSINENLQRLYKITLVMQIYKDNQLVEYALQQVDCDKLNNRVHTCLDQFIMLRYVQKIHDTFCFVDNEVNNLSKRPILRGLTIELNFTGNIITFKCGQLMDVFRCKIEHVGFLNL